MEKEDQKKDKKRDGRKGKTVPKKNPTKGKIETEHRYARKNGGGGKKKKLNFKNIKDVAIKLREKRKQKIFWGLNKRQQQRERSEWPTILMPPGGGW